MQRLRSDRAEVGHRRPRRPESLPGRPFDRLEPVFDGRVIVLSAGGEPLSSTARLISAALSLNPPDAAFVIHAGVGERLAAFARAHGRARGIALVECGLNLSSFADADRFGLTPGLTWSGRLDAASTGRPRLRVYNAGRFVLELNPGRIDERFSAEIVATVALAESGGANRAEFREAIEAFAADHGSARFRRANQPQ